jgi:hypothetical protein
MSFSGAARGEKLWDDAISRGCVHLEMAFWLVQVTILAGGFQSVNIEKQITSPWRLVA